MRKLFLAIALSLLLIPNAKATSIETRAKNITGALFNKDGFTCSGFAFKKVSKGYLFATAAHCAEPDEVVTVTFSANEDKPFYKADYIARGVADIAIYLVETNIDIKLIPLADEKKSKPGAEIINPGYILDSGKLLYYGRLIDNEFTHVSDNFDSGVDLGWVQHDMPIDIHHAPGSSGSPIIDKKRGVIVGILVGDIGISPSQSIAVAIQASQLQLLETAINLILGQ